MAVIRPLNRGETTIVLPLSVPSILRPRFVLLLPVSTDTTAAATAVITVANGAAVAFRTAADLVAPPFATRFILFRAAAEGRERLRARRCATAKHWELHQHGSLLLIAFPPPPYSASLAAVSSG